MGINRTEWDILYDLVEFLRLHKNVSQKQLANSVKVIGSEKTKYFKLMKDKGYITVDNEDHGTMTYHKYNVTAKGLELWDNIKNVYDLFGGERPIW